MRPNATDDSKKTLMDLFDLSILPVQTSPDKTPAFTDTQAQDTTLRRPNSSEPNEDPFDISPATADADARTILMPTPLRRSQRNRRHRFGWTSTPRGRPTETSHSYLGFCVCRTNVVPPGCFLIFATTIHLRGKVLQL
ncbi:hypothetical protein Y032_0673g1396 [Ancylostoma ceylanicum]|uniref:Uncharacterized protein n=1 Tax=Ancylostoma ceylanicum TaxID=53326 RepID=A0A016WJG9_9BILA|nr:hypothetical protein Y032_0673g1396 [Ancylostoma ceylanicum]